MTEKQKYWLVDETGAKALVEGTEQRDRWGPLGWAESTEPTGNEFVWARHDGVADPARFPAVSLPAWMAKGWEPAAPPAPFDDTRPDVVIDTPEPPADADAKAKKPATSGNTREN